MLMKMLLLASSLNCLVCTSLANPPVYSSIYQYKRREKTPYVRTQVFVISRTLSRHILACKIQRKAKELQASAELYLAQHGIESSTCRLCMFKLNNISGIYSSYIINGLSLIQLIPKIYNCRNVYDVYLYSPVHLNCVLIQIGCFAKLHADLCESNGVEFADEVLSSTEMFVIELKWLVMLLKQLTIREKQTSMPIIRINNQFIYSNSKLDANWLKRDIYPSLPKYAKEIIRKKYNVCELADQHNLYGVVYDYKVCKKMLNFPFLFFIDFDKNIKQIEEQTKLCQFYINFKKGLVKQTMADGDHKIVNRPTEIQRRISLIISVIDIELRTIYNDTEDKRFNDHLLKIVIIIYIIQTIVPEILKAIKPDIGILTNMLSRFNKTMDYINFRNVIYSLGMEANILKYDNKTGQPEETGNIIYKFIEFIKKFKELKEMIIKLRIEKAEMEIAGLGTKDEEREMNIRENERDIERIEKEVRLGMIIIRFWIVKLMLNAKYLNMPSICYILYEMDMMKEASIYMLVHYLLIIRRVLLKENSGILYVWFEEFVEVITTKLKIKKVKKLVGRVAFLNIWEDQRSKGYIFHMEQIEQLNNDIKEKVYNLFAKLYNDMENIAKGVRKVTNKLKSKQSSNMIV